VPAGIGAHQLETVQACVAAGLAPDFWVKTLHHCDYWSAAQGRPERQHLVREPRGDRRLHERAAPALDRLQGPRRGRIPPSDGFKYAFRNGADFICVGMYDFQIVEDVNIALGALGESRDRLATLDRLGAPGPLAGARPGRSPGRGLGVEARRRVVLQPARRRLHHDEALHVVEALDEGETRLRPHHHHRRGQPVARVQSGARIDTADHPVRHGASGPRVEDVRVADPVPGEVVAVVAAGGERLVAQERDPVELVGGPRRVAAG